MKRRHAGSKSASSRPTGSSCPAATGAAVIGACVIAEWQPLPLMSCLAGPCHVAARPTASPAPAAARLEVDVQARSPNSGVSRLLGLLPAAGLYPASSANGLLSAPGE